MLSFSIVINTLNRGKLLQKTLESFCWLKYSGTFEVIVVNGPSTDDTDQVIESWLPKIRVGHCDIPNLSVSRNIGICMAQGDIVVFIDDDAIPEPEWLTQLSRAYDNPAIGGAGGLVFDQTGYTFQYQYSTANRLGNSNWAAGRSAELYCFPGSFEFPYLQGTNASFRRSALLEIGGFDEEFEYYLDETELCCRLIDAGYVVRQLPDAYVHHKFAPSNIRDDHKITRYRYPVIKNKIYFSLKHARKYLSLSEIIEDNKNFSKVHESDIEFHISGGRLSDKERARFKEENERAWELGLKRGLSDCHELISDQKLCRWQGGFLPFSPIHCEYERSIVIVSRDFPPFHAGGIATFSRDLAEALAAEGNLVHVITQSPDINRVDFESGVWVHRMALREIDRPCEALKRRIPPHIWNWSATAFEEAKRIASHRQIDVVEAPIWDCEGAAFLIDRRWPLITSLHTTLSFWLDSHSDKCLDSEWMSTFVTPMLSLERELMTEADAVRANSQGIVRDIEIRYDFKFPAESTKLVPHGIATNCRTGQNKTDGDIEILFVGRLELRKGIDILLKAIPNVIKEIPGVRFRIIGDSSLPGPDGVRFVDKFNSDYTGMPWLNRVHFEGRVEQDVLMDAYSTCDIFVAPSRFESFGLIFLEAMRAGKAVVGCAAGGMPEVVSHEVNGLLVEPGNVQEFVAAILELAINRDLRLKMGAAGKRIFDEKFTAKRMAEESGALYDLAKTMFSGSC